MERKKTMSPMDGIERKLKACEAFLGATKALDLEIQRTQEQGAERAMNVELLEKLVQARAGAIADFMAADAVLRAGPKLKKEERVEAGSKLLEIAGLINLCVGLDERVSRSLFSLKSELGNKLDCFQRNNKGARAYRRTLRG
ncbi:MAG: hypothetical protein GXP49_12425 [Deltaproteobacteria bacterium]|nr:hypothetical protein [Deltaproteobacteria bacterium]